MPQVLAGFAVPATELLWLQANLAGCLLPVVHALFDNHGHRFHAFGAFAACLCQEGQRDDLLLPGQCWLGNAANAINDAASIVFIMCVFVCVNCGRPPRPPNLPVY